MPNPLTVCGKITPMLNVSFTPDHATLTRDDYINMRAFCLHHGWTDWPEYTEPVVRPAKTAIEKSLDKIKNVPDDKLS